MKQQSLAFVTSALSLTGKTLNISYLEISVQTISPEIFPKRIPPFKTLLKIINLLFKVYLYKIEILSFY